MGWGSRTTALFLGVSALALVACNAIVGIDSPEPADQNGVQPGTDGGMPGVDGSKDGMPPKNDDGGDAPYDGNTQDAGSEEAPPPPPPVAGKPGMDITAAGTYGKSSKYALVAAVGESPGGNSVGKSSKFTLQAGVVAVTQPQ